MSAADPMPTPATPGGVEHVAAVWQLTPAEANVIAAANGARSDGLREATRLLEVHVKRDRIPSVVRRCAPGLTHGSLLDMATAGDSPGVLAVCEAMFAYDDITSGVDLAARAR